MKWGLQTLRTGGALMAALALAGGLPAQTGPDCLPDIDPDCGIVVPLLMGQFTEVGSVVVQSTGDELCVTYLLNEAALAQGWLLYETHLAIGDELADIPQTAPNKWGTNPIPGHFPYGETLDPGLPCWTVCLDLAALGFLPGDSLVIAAHAVVGYYHETYGLVTETAWGEGDRFNQRGNWGMHFAYALCEPVLVPSYIGYEDKGTGCDFDYNDFGMDCRVVETYAGDVLRRIDMAFVARVNRAAYDHDIHIRRALTGSYTYSLVRDHAVFGTEAPEVAGMPGSGDFDVILYDSAAWPNSPLQEMGQLVEISILLDEGNLGNIRADFSPVARFDLDDMFSLYDPWMENRSAGIEIHISSVKPAAPPLPLPDPPATYEVPCILVVPTSDWAHPGETVTVTGPYPLFYDYYLTQSPVYADWWLLAP